MKKFILGAIATIAIAGSATAQGSENLDVWKRNKGINLSYITHQSLKDTESLIPYQYDSKAGFSLSTGNTYLWPRSEGWAGNRLKVGVDARWFDISYVKYKKFPKVNGMQIQDWMIEDGDFDYDYDYDYGYDYGYEDEEEDIDNISTQQLHLGVGIGPAIAVVPFSSANSALRFLRVNIYGHFNPSASALFLKDVYGESNASWAFVAAWDFGMNFQWKYFTLGFEGRWGTAKYKTLFSDDEDDWDYEDGDVSFNGDSVKQKFKNSSFRISLGFRF